MKKILLFSLVALLTLTFASYGADVETGQVAELYEQPHGRSVIYDRSELVTIWYEGSSVGGFGVSGTTASTGLTLMLYEDGQPVTATRFDGYAQVSIGCNGGTSNTVKRVVELINSDTSGYFKAAQGRDATPGTSTWNVLAANIVTGIPSTEDSAINDDSNRYVLREDCSGSLQLRAGFKPNSRKTYRLKLACQNVKGVGTQVTKIWDGEDCVYRRPYGTQIAYDAATPLTISFTDYGAKGLAATKGNNLTVTSEWSSSLTGTSESDANMSIIVGEWTE